MKKYIALFEYEESEKGYGVIFPDLPGLASAGDNYDEAYRMAHEGLAFHLEGLAEEGFLIPEPRTLEQIMAEWEDWTEWEKNYKFLVTPIAVIPAHGKTICVNVMLPEATLHRIDRVSGNRSAFLTNAAELLLDEQYMYN